MKMRPFVLALLLGMALPWGVYLVAEHIILQQAQVEQPKESSTSATLSTMEPMISQEESLKIPILCDDGTVKEMELDTYLTCVVLAEMPADFEEEALKAQAVVARTYALKRYTSAQKHTLGAVCTDYSCCQAYCTPEVYLTSGGTQEMLDKVNNAVLQTHNQVLMYEDKLIEATYFSCSGGRTEDAEAVWGQDVPYLQSVESPGEESATHYVDTVSFSSSDFSSLLGVELSGSSGTWLGEVTHTDGGGIETIEIGGIVFSGTTVRQLLGLRSTAFIMTAVGDTITITTKGFGHRVGMSQYGAEAMAVQGSDYTQILGHYYPGTTLQNYQG